MVDGRDKVVVAMTGGVPCSRIVVDEIYYNQTQDELMYRTGQMR